MDENQFDRDKADWQWETAAEEYCGASGKALEALTEAEQEIIWENSANHIAFFLTWLIDNDLLSEMHEEWPDDIQAVKSRQMTGYAYLCNNCDLVLSREDLSQQAAGFADTFYDNYLSQYSCYMIDKRHKEILATPFCWDDYEAVRVEVIDIAYQHYLATQQAGE